MQQTEKFGVGRKSDNESEFLVCEFRSGAQKGTQTQPNAKGPLQHPQSEGLRSLWLPQPQQRRKPIFSVKFGVQNDGEPKLRRK